MKKYKVTFLLDKKKIYGSKSNLKIINLKKRSKYFFSISKDYKKIKKQNIVFPISNTKILPKKFLSNHEYVLIPIQVSYRKIKVLHLYKIKF